jgi:hypothetical protein
MSRAGINLRMIDQGSSELSIIVGVDDSDFEATVRAIILRICTLGIFVKRKYGRREKKACRSPGKYASDRVPAGDAGGLYRQRGGGGGGLISLPAYYWLGCRPMLAAGHQQVCRSSLGTLVAAIRYGKARQVKWLVAY